MLYGRYGNEANFNKSATLHIKDSSSMIPAKLFFGVLPTPF